MTRWGISVHCIGMSLCPALGNFEAGTIKLAFFDKSRIQSLRGVWVITGGKGIYVLIC